MGMFRSGLGAGTLIGPYRTVMTTLAPPRPTAALRLTPHGGAGPRRRPNHWLVSEPSVRRRTDHRCVVPRTIPLADARSVPRAGSAPQSAHRAAPVTHHCPGFLLSAVRAVAVPAVQVLEIGRAAVQTEAQAGVRAGVQAQPPYAAQHEPGDVHRSPVASGASHRNPARRFPSARHADDAVLAAPPTPG